MICSDVYGNRQVVMSFRWLRAYTFTWVYVYTYIQIYIYIYTHIFLFADMRQEPKKYTGSTKGV